MTIRRVLFVLLIFQFILCRHSTGPTAEGGGGSEVEVTGVVLTPDGGPAALATVRLRPAGYVAQPAASGLAKRATSTVDLTTDSDGRFFIRGVEPGSYTIEITDRMSVATSLVLDAVPGEDTLDLGPATLQPFAALHGTVTPDPAAGSLSAAVYGLERSVPVDPVTGAYTFTDLPEGTWSVRIESSSPDLAAAILDAPAVQAGSSDTVENVVLESFADEDYTEWTCSRSIRINTSPTGANISEDVYEFPLLVRLDAFNFGFQAARGDGRDIRFAKTDGTPLRYEIEQWDPAARRAAVWVLMDTVYAANDSQSITMYWGKADAQDFSNGAAVFDTANGFAGVWHFDAASYTRDATALRNTAVDSHTVAAVGVSGSARKFEETFMYVPDNPTLEPPTLTLSIWCRPSRFEGPAGKYKFVHKGRPGGNPLFSSYALEYHEADRFIPAFMVCTQDSTFSKGISPKEYIQGRWYHMTGVFDNTTRSGALYINGTLIDTFTTPAPLNYYPEVDHPLAFGCQFYQFRNSATAFVHATMDEIRLSRTVRSSSWIRLAYENARPGSRMVEIR